jgi:hypothetical protein
MKNSIDDFVGQEAVESGNSHPTINYRPNNLARGFSKIKQALYLGLLGTALAVILAACANGSPTPAPTSTSTSTPTSTSPPTATQTYTPTSTYTPVPTIVIDALNPYLTGVGEHGAMICLNPADSSQLDLIVLKANISQNGKILDRNVPAENMDENGTCFEALDAKYQVGVTVSVELNATGRYGIAIENSKQVSEIGNFEWIPFLRWVYGDSPLNTNLDRLGFPSLNHPNSYDLQPLNANFPDGLNHPVYSPCDGEITLYEYVDLGGNNQFHNLFLYCEDTGYVMQLGHMKSILQGGRFVLGDQSIPIEVGEEIGKLVMEPKIGFCHNHTTLLRPFDLSSLSGRCLGGMINDPSCSEVIDFFNPTLTTGVGFSPVYGLWLPQFLPESTKKYIESGAIKPNY